MKKIYFLAVICCLAGCGPTNYERATSQTNVLARKDFNEINFHDGGKTSEVDPWGQEIVWELKKGWLNYELIVRSPGYDGLLYTRDDIVANKYYAIPRSGEKGAESFAKGLSRGFVRGAKEGLKSKN